MGKYIISLDQGTTSSRAVIFDEQGRALHMAQHPIKQYYEKPGWVEHDAQEILSTQILALAQVYEKSGVSPQDILGIGVTNQRETVVLWERDSGKPIHKAIVWQCRRTAPAIERLKADNVTGMITQKTGLIPDAYFSASKIQWLLDNVPGARNRAQNGEILCGTIDSWLIWNLTGGKHVSDHSNCSRTMLFDIDRLMWDNDLCRLFDIPMHILPAPVSNSEHYGKIKQNMQGLHDLAGVPICGAAGDQQAALFGQCCFESGRAKNTYGTGCFTLVNAGHSSVRSKSGLLSSIGWTISGRSTYVLEGSVFNAGSAIQWLRDEMGIISASHECDMLASSVPDNGGVYMVPAFTGLGAPYWDMYARGAVLGITRGSTKAHFARAALESIAFQVADLCNTMQLDLGRPLKLLRADGGASVSDFLLSFQADLLGCAIERPSSIETTAAGAAYLAGLAAGLWSDERQLEAMRGQVVRFEPRIDKDEAKNKMARWHKAVERAINWEEHD